MSIKIYYDGDCPFCAKYVSLLRLKQHINPVALHDLRSDKSARDYVVAQGFDPDKGMLVDYNGTCTYGADAMNTLALLSTPSSLLNKITSSLLSNAAIASMLYPVFRSIRWLVLFLLGNKTFAEEKQTDKARQVFFALFFSLFSLFHFFNYSFEYDRFPPQLDQIFILITAILLFFNPGSSRILFLLVLVSSISTIIQAPVNSNHTMVRSMWLLGYWCSFCWCMLKAKSYVAIFTTSAMAGQGALLVMYFFGIFHKINTDFLNPATSCAVALWQKMPTPLSYFDQPAVHYLTIYGTFVVEGLLIVALLTSRYRHVGIVFGILFHLLLSLSSYALYISFTTLAIALHCLFLSGDAAQRIIDSPEINNLRAKIKQKLYLVLALGLILCMAWLAYHDRYTQVALIAMIFVLPFCFLIFKYGKSINYQASTKSTKFIGVVITILFFVNCSLPYLGLKSAQTVNMFANIRIEGGVSNHLIFSSPNHYFAYLSDIVEIKNIQGGTNPGLAMQNNYAEVYYDVLAALDNDPTLKITFVRDGVLYENQSTQDLQEDIDTILHPPWVRKWFHFQPVYLEVPEKCNN